MCVYISVCMRTCLYAWFTTVFANTLFRVLSLQIRFDLHTNILQIQICAMHIDAEQIELLSLTLFFFEWIAVCLCEWSAPIIFYFAYILSTKENVKQLLRKKVMLKTIAGKRLEIGSKQSKSTFKKFFVLLIISTEYQISNIYDLFKKYCSF